MSLIIFPLSQSSQTLRRILLLLKQLVEYFHGLVIRNDSLAIELILPILEPNDILEAVAGIRARSLGAFALPLLALQ